LLFDILIWTLVTCWFIIKSAMKYSSNFGVSERPVELFTLEMLPSLIKLAREVEPLFESPMTEDDGFHTFIRRKVAQHEAFIVRDGGSNEVKGLIAISHHNSAISWLAVFEKHRGKGVGSSLLAKAITELGRGNEISVVTFRADNEAGIPARKLYQKFGFIDYDVNYYHDGLIRCLMKRSPEPA
jgi:GNAT superfamily N-acetyltransferase